MRIFLILLCLFSVISGKAQYSQNDTLTREAIVYNADTIPVLTLEYVYIYGFRNGWNASKTAEYNRLRNAVYVTYPYARRAGAVMNDINANLGSTTDKSIRKKYIHSREKELKKEFTDPIKNLSVYQGKVLMKLINRETGNNCYEIIKEYKGGVTARLYQTVAFFFDSNLKQSYNPLKEDLLVEAFVKEVQRMYGYADVKAVTRL